MHFMVVSVKEQEQITSTSYNRHACAQLKHSLLGMGVWKYVLRRLVETGYGQVNNLPVCSIFLNQPLFLLIKMLVKEKRMESEVEMG